MGKKPAKVSTKRKVGVGPMNDMDGHVQEGRDFYRISRPPAKSKVPDRMIDEVTPQSHDPAAKPENRVARAVLDAAFEVHTTLGPGLLESVYEMVLAHELRTLGFRVEQQMPIAIRYKDFLFKKAFVADLLVDGLVIVELKSVEQLAPIHAKQLLTQLRLMQKRLGLLINFGGIHLRDNIRRLANGLDVSPPPLWTL